MTREIRAIILAGVAGVGKSTIGTLLAAELDWPFFDTNVVHPQANNEKMGRGIALDEKDRWPWLERVREIIDGVVEGGGSGVFECSALKEEHRRYLVRGRPETRLILLAVDREAARLRVAARRGSYFPANLVDSQFEALEVARPGITVDGSASPAVIARPFREQLGLFPERP